MQLRKPPVKIRLIGASIETCRDGEEVGVQVQICRLAPSRLPTLHMQKASASHIPDAGRTEHSIGSYTSIAPCSTWPC